MSTSEQERRINNQLYHIEKALQEAADDPPTWLLVAGHYPVYSASKTVFVIFVSSKESIEN